MYCLITTENAKFMALHIHCVLFKIMDGLLTSESFDFVS